MALNNFSWVIPQKLAGSDMPGKHAWDEEAIREDISILAAEGVRSLVSLELPAGPVELICGELGLEWCYYPIPDYEVPTDLRSFSEQIDTIIDSFAMGKPVCVHCHAGIGRTGLVLSCVMGRYFGIDGEKAIAAVRRTRTALDTMEQQSFVISFLEQDL